MSRQRITAALALLLVPGLCGCEKITDLCAGYELACATVKIPAGPADTYQLLVSVDRYGSTTPYTPRKRPNKPLEYPLRFPIRFGEFDKYHPGYVFLNISAQDQYEVDLAAARVRLDIDHKDKREVVVNLGHAFDLWTPPEDLSASPPDLAPASDAGPPDMSALADSGPGN